MNWFSHTHALTLRLVQAASVTETAGETAFAEHLKQTLLQHPYFQAHPDHICLLETEHDFRQRFVVYAVVRASQDYAPTLILTGHYDTVNVANYGPLESLACDPIALLPKLIEELQQSQAHPPNAHNEAILRDLLSGDYLPGRGTLDMKSGLAAGIAVMERFAELSANERRGNVLLMAVCDEENYSHGMRTALTQLQHIAEKWKLTLSACVSLDAGLNDADGTEARTVYLGSVGKVMPTALFVGRPTHAGAPFDGISATLFSAEFVRLCEASEVLSGNAQVFGETPPAPVCLQHIDLKTFYDVTTPTATWCAFNVLVYELNMQVLLDRLKTAASKAMQQAIALMQTRARDYAHHAKVAAQIYLAEPIVLTYDELLERVRKQANNWQDVRKTLIEYENDLRLDALTVSRKTTEYLVQMAHLQGPCVVVGFAPVYYPVTHLGDDAHAKRLSCAVESATERLNHLENANIRIQHFMPGIADMSFIGSAHPIQPLLMQNTPAWQKRWHLPTSASVSLPSVNIGPCGRDYHQRGERVFMPYSFETLPALIWNIVNVYLGDL
jgi:arginine utilization protein RocB